MDNETLHSLIPLADFKAVLSLDDREDAMSRYCLITATYTIEQYCLRRLFLKKHFERIETNGDLLLPLREYPVREVLAVYALDGIGETGELVEPEFYRVIPDLEAENEGLPEDTIYSLSLSPAFIPVTLPYIRLTKNIWTELSGLATAYRCHLECAPEKPLVFAHSPYQTEPLQDDDYSYTFTGQDIFYLRKTDKAELYRNSVRLKINLPIALEKQEIWRYDEAPVLYDENLQPHYPFKYPLVREIEMGNYEARYSIIDASGKERAVVFADDIDSKEETENRLDYVGGPFSYSAYDVTSHTDKAILTLHKDADGDLSKAAIYGRPIVLDLNRSCFGNDSEGIAAYGTAALNVTGSYFSEHLIDGKPQYEDWVGRELAERIQNRREFTVKTHRGLFNARVGAKVRILTQRELLQGMINAFSFRYRKNEAFVASFKIRENFV